MVPQDSPHVTTERLRKTKDKTQRGDLPTPSTAKRTLMLGTGVPCDGCGETLSVADMMCAVSTKGLLLKFHVDCHRTWKDTKPLHEA
jgi:hypothetical protein